MTVLPSGVRFERAMAQFVLISLLLHHTDPASGFSTSSPGTNSPPPGTNGTNSPPPGTDSTPTGTDSTPTGTYSPPTDTYSTPTDTYSPPTGTYSPPPDTYSPPTDTYSPPTGTYSPPTGTYSPSPDTYSTPTVTYSPPPGTYSTPPGTYSTPPGTYSPSPGTYSTPPGTYSPSPGTYSPSSGSYPPQFTSPPSTSGSPTPDPSSSASSPGFLTSSSWPTLPSSTAHQGSSTTTGPHPSTTTHLTTTGPYPTMTATYPSTTITLPTTTTTFPFTTTTDPITTTTFPFTTTTDPITTTTYPSTTNTFPTMTTTFPFTATTDPITTTTYPSTTTTDPITTTTYTSTTTTDPITTTTYTSTTTTDPITTTTYPSTSTTYPNTSTYLSTYPNTTTTYPSTTTTYPNTTTYLSTYPNTTTTYPSTTTTYPNTSTYLSTYPNTTTTYPSTTTTYPNTTTYLSTYPNTTTTYPSTTTTYPNTSTYLSTYPNTTTTYPSTTTTYPNTTTYLSTYPNTTTTYPSTTTTDPNTTTYLSTYPNTTTTYPSTTTTYPNTSTYLSTYPNTTTTYPSTTTTYPNTTTYLSTYPNTTTTYPSTTTTYPNTSTYLSTYPNTTTTYPSTTTTDPTTTTTFPSTTATHSTTTASGGTACDSYTCNNGGTCHVVSALPACSCLAGFSGTACQIDSISNITSVNITNSAAATRTLNGSLSKINDGVTKLNDNMAAMPSFLKTVGTVVGKLLNASTWTNEAKKTLGNETITTAVNMLSALSTCNTDISSTCSTTTDVKADISAVENNVLALGDIMTSVKDDFYVSNPTVQIKLRKKDANEMVQEPVSVEGVKIALPKSLGGSTDKLLLKVIVYNKDVYEKPSSSSQWKPSGHVVLARLENQHGKAQDIDASDPVQMTLEPLVAAASADTLADDTIRCLEGDGDILSAEFTLPSGRGLTLTGRFGNSPTESVFDFSFVVSSSSTGAVATHPYDNVVVTFANGVARMFVMQSAGASLGVCVRATYTGSVIASGRRRLLATSTQTITTSSLSVMSRNEVTQTWEHSNHVKIDGVDNAGKLTFKSNFFGTFTLSEMVVVPTPIDFNDIFLNFEAYLRDSPYVLAVVLSLLVVSVLILLILRRLDKADSVLWAYLPLVDNRGSDPYIYTLSVHTALSSSRHMTATPCFLLRGHYEDTDIRVLCDGVRENFKSGTVSNFVMTTPYNLGPLLELRVWHDNGGTSPHWKLDRVVVRDQSNQECAVFVCQDWLSTDKSDGKISRRLPAVSPLTFEGTQVFDIVSKQRLFDDHLWLSVTRRPAYSTFSRVQRYVTSLAVLFLSMVTNAMFYPGKEADYVAVRGVELGPLQINYRQLFVGAVSAVIIVIPAAIIAFSFKRRKVKGVVYPSFTTRPQHPDSPRAAVLPADAVLPSGMELRPLAKTTTLPDDAACSSSADRGATSGVSGQAVKISSYHENKAFDADTSDEDEGVTLKAGTCSSSDGAGGRGRAGAGLEARQSPLPTVAIISSAEEDRPSCSSYQLPPREGDSLHAGRVRYHLQRESPLEGLTTNSRTSLSSVPLILPGFRSDSFGSEDSAEAYLSVNTPRTRSPASSAAGGSPRSEPGVVLTVEGLQGTGAGTGGEEERGSVTERLDACGPVTSPSEGGDTLKAPVTLDQHSEHGSDDSLLPNPLSADGDGADHTRTTESDSRQPKTSSTHHVTFTDNPPAPASTATPSSVLLTEDDNKSGTKKQDETMKEENNCAADVTVSGRAGAGVYGTVGADRSKMKKKTAPSLLPWWFVFVGYGMTALCVTAGAFFTFLYSLQWGGKTSLEWLLALFFSTSTGTLLVEPVKIVFISVALSCLFRQLAHSEIAATAPFTAAHSQFCYSAKLGTPSPLPAPVEDPTVSENTEEVEQRRKSLQLHRRMYDVMRGLTAQALYVALLFVLSLHGDVHESFLQNDAVRSQLALKQLDAKVSRPVDAMKWLKDDLIPSLQPVVLHSGSNFLTVEERRFITDQCNFRVSPVTLTQYRVQGECDLYDKVTGLIGNIRCVPQYHNGDFEETRSFLPGWTECQASCTDTAYVYDAGDEMVMAQEARGNFFGPGGYRVTLESTQWEALRTLQQLSDGGWLNVRTRALNLEVNLFNPNTRLFTQAKVLLEFPAVGSCLRTVSLRSARLYPYITPWDYLVLLLQLIFIVVVVGRLCVVMKRLCFPSEGSGRCWDGAVVTLVEVLVSLAAIVIYIVRIDRTIFVLERVRNEPDKFSSWDVVFFLDAAFRLALSACLFVRMLAILGPLSFNRALHVLRVTLLRSRSQLYGLALVVIFVLTAFASFFFLFEGPITYRLRNFVESYQTLLTVLLTMTKYKALKTEGGDNVSGSFHRVMYGFYCFVAVMIVVNFAITILNVYMADVKLSTRDYNNDLGAFAWDKLSRLFASCGCGNGRSGQGEEDTASNVTEESSAEQHAEEMNGFEQLEAKLEEMLRKLTKRYAPEDTRLRAVHSELYRTRNRLREVEHEAQQHKAQLELLKATVRRLSEDALNVQISFNGDKTIIRILSKRNTLLYMLALTNESERPLITCTAMEMTRTRDLGLESDVYGLVSTAAKLSFASPKEFETVEVGFPGNPRISPENHALAIKYSDSMPWLYIPVTVESKVFCPEESGMVWTILQGLPVCLASLVMADRKTFTCLRKCMDCEFSTYSPDAFRSHHALHEDSGVVTCKYSGCGVNFLEKYKLLKHLQEKHDYPLVCQWCGHSASSARALQVHVALHFERQHECEHCGQRFLTRQQRDGHKFIAHGSWREERSDTSGRILMVGAAGLQEPPDSQA